MKTRPLASVALVAAILLGTTGCTFITTQATDIVYNPADGVGFDIGDLQVRDAFIVANEDGTLGSFAAAIINTGDSSARLALEYGPVGDSARVTIPVPARTTLTLGNSDEAVLLADLGAKPGATISVEFSSGDDSTLLMVPVLDGMPYNENLVPRAER